LLCSIWCHCEAGDLTLRGGKGFEVKLNERNVDEDDQISLYFGLVLSFETCRRTPPVPHRIVAAAEEEETMGMGTTENRGCREREETAIARG